MIKAHKDKIQLLTEYKILMLMMKMNKFKEIKNFMSQLIQQKVEKLKNQ